MKAANRWSENHHVLCQSRAIRQTIVSFSGKPSRDPGSSLGRSAPSTKGIPPGGGRAAKSLRQIAQQSSEAMGREALTGDPAHEVAVAGMIRKLDEFLAHFSPGMKTSDGLHGLSIDLEVAPHHPADQGPEPAQRRVQRSFEDVVGEALRRQAVEGAIAFGIRAFSSFVGCHGGESRGPRRRAGR